jgi:nucleoside-diphosphate-sugar epimerase
VHNILITGASGFLGRATLKSLLLDPDLFVFVAYRAKTPRSFLSQLDTQKTHIFNVEIESEIKELFSKYEVQTILHLATNYGRHNQNIDSVLSANLVLPLTLLTHGLPANVQHFINIDSFYNKAGNLNEELFNYSQSKKALIPWLKQYSNQTKVSNLILEHMYGPGDAEDKFIPTLIRSSLCDFSDGLKLSRGQQERDFIFLDDVVSAIQAILGEKNKDDQIGYQDIGVGHGKGTSLIELAAVINAITGTSSPAPFSDAPYKKHEIMSSVADNSKLISLGWNPQIDLINGLTRTAEFYGHQ